MPTQNVRTPALVRTGSTLLAICAASSWQNIHPKERKKKTAARSPDFHSSVRLTDAPSETRRTAGAEARDVYGLRTAAGVVSPLAAWSDAPMAKHLTRPPGLMLGFPRNCAPRNVAPYPPPH